MYLVAMEQKERQMNSFSEKANFIWSVADFLRGRYE